MGQFRLLLVLLLLPLPAGLGQNNPQSQPVEQQPPEPAKGAPIPTPGGTNRQITLDVQVTDSSGLPVRGLQRQDFTLLDEKHPQDILSFHAVDRGTAPTADSPVEIVMVVDGINTSFDVITSERNEIKKFLLQNGGKLEHPVSLIFVTSTATKVQDIPSRDGHALAALYDRSATGLPTSNLTRGGYGALDRFELSMKAVSSLATYEATRPGRKLMIWISPGWPLLSGSNLEFTPKDWQRLFDSIVNLSNETRKARITLDVVDPSGPIAAGGTQNTYYKEFLKGVTSPSQAEIGALSLQVHAIQSGGRVLYSTNDLATAIANCVADADAFYVVSFNTAPAKRPNEYHTLGVTVDKPGITVRTLSGYYAQP